MKRITRHNLSLIWPRYVNFGPQFSKLLEIKSCYIRLLLTSVYKTLLKRLKAARPFPSTNCETRNHLNRPMSHILHEFTASEQRKTTLERKQALIEPTKQYQSYNHCKLVFFLTEG